MAGNDGPQADGFDDLVFPLPRDSAKPGAIRPRQYSGDRFEQDLFALGLRHRRGHDLRRTFISLARSDGARADILRRVTHKPPPEVFEGYTTFEWEVVCREVMKLKVHRRGAADVTPIRVTHAAGTASGRGRFDCARDGLATSLATVPSQLPILAMKITMALPGLEPDHCSSDEGRSAEVASDGAQVSGGYGGLIAAHSALEAALPTLNCSNVANALRGTCQRE